MSNRLIDPLIDLNETYTQHKHDHDATAGELTFDETASLVLPSNLFGQSPPVVPTEWALGQICSRLGPTVFGRGRSKSVPRDYLMAIPPELRATLLNDHLNHTDPDQKWLVRCYKDEARAILSGRYSVIDNDEVLKIIQQIEDEQPDLPGKQLIRSQVTPDRLHVKMTWADSDDGNYAIGAYVGNGEIGNSKIKVFPFVQRHSCTNSIVLDRDAGVEFVHTGNMTAKFVMFKAHIIEAFKASDALLDKLMQAENEKLPNFLDVIEGLSNRYNWNDHVKEKIILGSEGKMTRAGLVNGVTFAAHTAFNDADAQVDMEIMGGRILVADESLFAQAARVANQNNTYEMAYRMASDEVQQTYA